MDEPCNILLVEDRDDDALFFTRALGRKTGFNIVARATDGDEAIAYLAGTGIYGDRQKYPYPDIMILDLKLPNRNGFQVLEWMRGKVPRPKVGVFSVSDLPEDQRKAHELGADLFQTKTFEPVAVGRFLHSLELLARGQP